MQHPMEMVSINDLSLADYATDHWPSDDDLDSLDEFNQDEAADACFNSALNGGPPITRRQFLRLG